MVSLKKALVGVSVVLIACCVKAQTPSIYELQTLREVLRFRHLPTYGFTTKELERRLRVGALQRVNLLYVLILMTMDPECYMNPCMFSVTRAAN